MNKQKEALDYNKFDYPQLLNYLRINYLHILKILDNFCTCPVFLKDLRLNFCYMNLLKTVNTILELKSFEDLKKEKPELFEDLISDIEDMDIEWESGYSQVAYKFLARIEKEFIDKGYKFYEFPKGINHILENTVDKAISAYGQENKLIFEGMLKKIEKESGLKRVDQPSEESNNDLLEYGGIILNLSKATLQYKDNNQIEIQPDNKEIKFLKLLIQNKGNVLKYEEIAKKMRLSFYYESALKAIVAREVQFLKRDLGNVLRKAGLTQKEITKMIITKKKVGYKLKDIK